MNAWLKSYLGMFPKEFRQKVHSSNKLYIIVASKVMNT